MREFPTATTSIRRGTVGWIPETKDNGRVLSATDLAQVLSGGKYLSGEPATWSDGDWTGDGVFNQRDIVMALESGGFPQAPLAAILGFAHNQGQPAWLGAKNGPATGEDESSGALDELFATSVDDD